MPEQKESVYERVSAILGQLPAIGKDARNQQQNFMYRSHDAVLNALNPLLYEHGVFLVPRVVDRVTAQRTTKSGTLMYEVNLHVEYTFYGEGGDSFVASAWGEGTDSGDKSTNKAMTMAFKNVIAQVFAVSTADTVDSDSQSPEETVAARVWDWKLIGEYLKATDATLDWQKVVAQAVKHVYDVDDWRTLPAAAQREVGNRMQKVCETLPSPESFPPATDEQIQAAFAAGFDGAVVEITREESNAALSPEAQEKLKAASGEES